MIEEVLEKARHAVERVVEAKDLRANLVLSIVVVCRSCSYPTAIELIVDVQCGTQLSIKALRGEIIPFPRGSRTYLAVLQPTVRHPVDF